ncbi:MAG: hypothetical protein AAB956_01175, partial [Patescibacteria group bacterium]
MLKQKLRSWLMMLTVVLITIGFLGYLERDSIKKNFYSVRAAVSDNIAGYAWSENTGWISFNNISGGGNVNYGVNVDPSTGDITGRAWSENLGWISLNRADTGDPPSNPYKNNGPLANRNSGNGAVKGWMRVLAVCDTVPCASSGPGSNSGGWDGWIRFCDNTMAKCSGADQIAKIDASGNFKGWAWSNDKVGWISLYGVTATGINQAPTASSLTVSSIAASNYCKVPSHALSWTYSDPDGNAESQFQLQVDDDSNFGSPAIDRTVVATVASGDSNSQQAQVAVAAIADKLLYNDTTYNWRVKVWDSYGLASSDWINGTSFKTAKHIFPTVNFKSFPTSPSMNEVV